MSHLRCTTVALALLAAACGPSAAERCRDVGAASMAYETALGFEQIAQQAAEDSAEATGLRIGLARAKVRDAVLWRHRAAFGAKDSLASMIDSLTPPRPSDAVWYEENCYAGKPR